MNRRALRFPQSRLTWMGAVIVAVLVLVGTFAPVLAPYDPKALSGESLLQPTLQHLLGTNQIGQDIFSELIWGARTSLLIGLGGAGATVLLGVALGMVAGLMGGWVDVALMRAVDVLLGIPVLPTLILIAALAGSSLWTLILAIGFLGGPRTARILRSQVLRLRQRGFIGAARGFGGSLLYVLRRHLIPGVAPVIVAGFVNWAGLAISLEAGLAFLGLGNPFEVSWGQIIQQAISLPGWEFGVAWVWWALPAGFALIVAVLGFAFLGIGFEPALDRARPKRHKSAPARDTSHRRPVRTGPSTTPIPPTSTGASR